MDIIQQYKMTGFIRGFAKVAAYKYKYNNNTPNNFYTGVRVPRPFGALPAKADAPDMNIRIQNASNELHLGISRLRKKVDKPSTGTKPAANASPKSGARKKNTGEVKTTKVQKSVPANTQSQSSLTVASDKDKVNSTTLTVSSNLARTRRSLLLRLRAVYHKHPKRTIMAGAGAVTAAGAGLTSLIAALSGDPASAVAASVGPEAERKLPKRRYTQLGQGDVDRNHNNWDWYKQQLDASAKGRAGALAEAARQLAAAGIPEHLRYRAALLQSFADPNALNGKLLITKAQLEHAARQQAILWLKHLGIPASEYNVSQMSKYFSDYSRYALFGGIAPDILQYFRHLNTTNYKLALKTLGKWRKAVSHGF